MSRQNSLSGVAEKRWSELPGPDRLRAWRERADLTQQEVADMIKSDLASYNAFENGRERPGLDLAVAISHVTGGYVDAAHWADAEKLAIVKKQRARAS